jgi:hypothetical protein
MPGRWRTRIFHGFSFFNKQVHCHGNENEEKKERAAGKKASANGIKGTQKAGAQEPFYRAPFNLRFVPVSGWSASAVYEGRLFIQWNVR